MKDIGALANKEDQIDSIDVNLLRLDDRNPRLPEELLGASQGKQLAWLEEEESLEELASSMVTNGFFRHEPLVVSPDGSGSYTVVEGNRRFATLSILLQLPAAQEAGLTFDFEKEPSQGQLSDLLEVPCIVVTNPASVRTYLGFRHIGGLKKWSPEAKARYLEEEVDEAVRKGSKTPFKDVGRAVGSNALGVRGPYVALKILRVARDDFGFANASYILRERFGVWNRLLNSSEVREFIGFPEALDFDSVVSGLSTLRPGSLERVIGDLVARPGAPRAVLQDSRDATKYGRVIANANARSTLVKHGDLDLAYQVVDNEALPSRLLSFSRSLDVIVQSLDAYDLDTESLSAAQAVNSSSRNLVAIMRDRLTLED